MILQLTVSTQAMGVSPLADGAAVAETVLDDQCLGFPRLSRWEEDPHAGADAKLLGTFALVFELVVETSR